MTQRDKIIREATDAICKAAVDDGKLIEAGWLSLRAMVVSPDAPPLQLEEMRMAFFAGAQHLFGSMMSILDPDAEEETEADLRRMDLIAAELKQFVADFSARHGLSEAGPAGGTSPAGG
jgi:hypothetical protein